MELANTVKPPLSSSSNCCSSDPNVGRMTSCPGGTPRKCTSETSADYGLGCGLGSHTTPSSTLIPRLWGHWVKAKFGTQLSLRICWRC